MGLVKGAIAATYAAGLEYHSTTDADGLMVGLKVRDSETLTCSRELRHINITAIRIVAVYGYEHCMFLANYLVAGMPISLKVRIECCPYLGSARVRGLQTGIQVS